MVEQVLVWEIRALFKILETSLPGGPSIGGYVGRMRDKVRFSRRNTSSTCGDRLE